MLCYFSMTYKVYPSITAMPVSSSMIECSRFSSILEVNEEDTWDLEL